MIMEIECLANPPGTAENRYRHIEAAIAVIESSGLKYEVEALGTTIEGEPDQLWPLLRRVHDACIEAGADSVVTVVKVAQTSTQLTPSTMVSLTGKFRN
ncbi:MAG: thiamine-binding protein [Dehalococcoidia bacterium]|nr:thiamine-binding protein [Dehalococcoidia bacterium]